MNKRFLIFLYCILGFAILGGYFYGIGSYPLLDVDETRYVDMARSMFNSKDVMTLYLNGEFFFEKPPLYFWLECFSFKIFGAVSEFSARVPIVLLSLVPAGLLFLLCVKAKNQKFAVITSATLFTSLEYIFLTKMAILDSVMTSFVVSSVLCYFSTFYVEEKNKKYFWILTYVFSALAVLSKGIPGIAIPMITIVVSTIVFKTYKETLKYSWGIIIFLLIILPWHLIMLKMYGSLFFDEYIIKHHLLKFLGSDVIHRTQPWYFYIMTLLWGLFPHIFVAFAQIVDFKEFKFSDKFFKLNLIAAISILVFFSLSGAKLITYILPIYPFLAVLIGAGWYNYIENGNKKVNLALVSLNVFLSIAVILLLCIKFILPSEIYARFHGIQIVSLITFIPFVVINWVFILKKMRFMQFLVLVIFMAILSGVLTPQIYRFNYEFGQNDLMQFAKIAQNKGYTISTYLTGKRYSLLYYGKQSKIDFKISKDLNWLNKEIDKKNNILIMRNKDIKNLPIKIKEKGVKYSIVERGNDEK